MFLYWKVVNCSQVMPTVIIENHSKLTLEKFLDISVKARKTYCFVWRARCIQRWLWYKLWWLPSDYPARYPYVRTYVRHTKDARSAQILRFSEFWLTWLLWRRSERSSWEETSLCCSGDQTSHYLIRKHDKYTYLSELGSLHALTCFNSVSPSLDGEKVQHVRLKQRKKISLLYIIGGSISPATFDLTTSATPPQSPYPPPPGHLWPHNKCHTPLKSISIEEVPPLSPLTFDLNKICATPSKVQTEVYPLWMACANCLPVDWVRVSLA